MDTNKKSHVQKVNLRTHILPRIVTEFFFFFGKVISSIHQTKQPNEQRKKIIPSINITGRHSPS